MTRSFLTANLIVAIFVSAILVATIFVTATLPAPILGEKLASGVVAAMVAGRIIFRKIR